MKTSNVIVTAADYARGIATLLSKVPLYHLVAIAAGEAESAQASFAFERGLVDGFIALTDTPDGVVVTRRTLDDGLAALLDGAIGTVVSLVTDKEPQDITAKGAA